MGACPSTTFPHSTNTPHDMSRAHRQRTHSWPRCRHRAHSFVNLRRTLLSAARAALSSPRSVRRAPLAPRRLAQCGSHLPALRCTTAADATPNICYRITHHNTHRPS